MSSHSLTLPGRSPLVKIWGEKRSRISYNRFQDEGFSHQERGDSKLNARGWKTRNPGGAARVIVTKELPGDRWLEILAQADCRVEVCTSTEPLTVGEIRSAIGKGCDGCIGQLTEPWGEELFGTLKAAGGRAYSNYAVGHNNVDVESATGLGIPVGNTPGVLTETTAEMAVALTFAAARRVVESDTFMRSGRYGGWPVTIMAR